jgi:hypothetical protein
MGVMTLAARPRNQCYLSSPWPIRPGAFSSFTPVPANSLASSVSGQLRLPRAIIGLTGIHEIVIIKDNVFPYFFKRGGT